MFSLFTALPVARAQTLVTSPMTGTPAAGEYYNQTSITVSPNFTFTASPGQSLRLFIGSGADCQSFAGTQPSVSQNYIVTYTPREPNITNPTDQNLSSCQVMQTVQYFDGLGRPLQTVLVKGSTNGFDVVQPVAYDPFGREVQKFLPYSISSPTPGAYRPGAISEQTGFYQQMGQGYKNTPFPFSQTVFEASPLSRPLEQGAPGNDWQPAGTPGTDGNAGHTVKTAYGANAAGEVRLWAVNAGGGGASWNNNFYGAGQLYKTTLTDESGNQTVEYKDKQGHVVSKTASGLVTSYIYDDFENLAYVVPPVPAYPQSFGEGDQVYNQYIYGYHYDGRNRLVEKKLPGKDLEEMVYNQMDQVVFTRDGVQRSHNERAFTKYDGLGRVIMTGVESNHTLSRADLQNIVDQQSPYWEVRDNSGSNYQGYTSNSPPNNTPQMHPLVVNYYDNYDGIPDMPGYGATAGASTATSGLLTASKAAVLNPDGSYGPALWTVHYYDDKGRNIATYAQHYLNGTANAANYNLVTNTYNFTDQVTATNRQHYTTASGSPALSIATRYVYDHMGRKTDSYEQIGGSAEVLLSRANYNEVGQLLGKHLHSTNTGGSFLQDISYGYNERGWMASSSSGLFAMQLGYNSGPNAQWNGNISSQYWGTPGSLSKHYDYTYDALNRLTRGVGSEGYNETGPGGNGIDYDDLGNILHLGRTGGANNGNYTYHYNGNQLSSVDNLTGSYSYDQNGNMSHDGRNNTDVYYNMLDLPRSLPGKGLSYTYDATGQKLNKNNGSISTDYISGIQYENGVMQFVQTEEGRAIKSGGNWNYEYTLTDHLGNSRVNFQTVSGIADVKQTDDYYPFGLEILTSSYPSQKNQYLYNKKEKQEETGQYDYGARFYDPVVGRFTSIDPVAEHFPWMTSYQYASNDPVKNIDLDGLEGIPFSFFFENNALVPRLAPLAESATKYSPENIAKAGGEFSGKTLEAFRRGNTSETQQLVKNGLEKNNNPIKEIDPKTGQEGKTIPDAFKNDGKSTVEIKDVQSQSLTKQLRLQEKFSNDNGFKPELIINEGAKISKPLQNSTFDIKTYQSLPITLPADNTKVTSVPIAPPKPPQPPPCPTCL